MKLAFVYAGQGSQTAGMGFDFYEEYPQVRPLFHLKPLGLDLKELCFSADAATLAQTRYTQPCMGVFAAAVTKLLAEEGVKPEYTLGLSLGEYGALHAAGVWDGETLVSLLAFRGQAMEQAAHGIDSAMTAVFSLEREQIEGAIAQVGGPVWCCNFNCPGQVVIGGETEAVRRASEACLALGAKRCLPLKVGGPFHTPLMAPAAQALAGRFAHMELGEMQIPVIFNVNGDFLSPEERVSDMLIRQVKSPVLLENSLEKLRDLGIDTVIEIGPGKVIAGFLRKVAPEIRCLPVESVAGFRTAVETLKGEGV